MNKIRKEDTVQVLTGKEKGKTGRVLKVLQPTAKMKKRGDESQRVLVEALNKVKRHTKPSNTDRQGGIVEKEAPLHISNVALLSPTTGKPVRVGFQEVDGPDGKKKKVRVCHKTGEVLDNV